ncbi:four helix bundle protein [Terrimonas alba]|uniref:four helix bundle protein n=1 Tax=Terrimonas alba TaxID=3349636 RepID=UPI0035F3F139
MMSDENFVGNNMWPKKNLKFSHEISRSSLVEVDTQFEIAIILDYYKKGQMAELEQYLESVFRMLSKMIGNLGGGRS